MTKSYKKKEEVKAKEVIKKKVLNPNEMVTVEALAVADHDRLGRLIIGKVYPKALKRCEVGNVLFKIIEQIN